MTEQANTLAAPPLPPAETGGQRGARGNFARHVGALTLTKGADGLIDPKLVLSWLLTQGGASAGLIGLLVPLREAGALLPQLFTAVRIGAMRRRKWAWAAGSLVQGVAAAAMCLASLALTGRALGLAICAALAVLAVARSVCSVSYKDVLGRTIAKGRRGAVTGLAGALAAGVVLVFALILLAGPYDRRAVVLVALALAALSWGGAAALMAAMAEPADGGVGSPRGGGLSAALGQLRLLRRDRTLARFVVARGLLTATALAPPYIVILAGGQGGPLSRDLGAMVLAASLAGLVSSYVWGRLADRSSRRVLIWAGPMGALGMAAALAFHALGMMAQAWAPASALFVVMLAHQGVRLGRSTYLVDMAPAERRAAYTSVANTVIGLALLAGGGFGALAAGVGAWVTLAVFALMALAAAAVAHGLREA